MPNLLARERSPYLLQHANNPVEWYPWGEAAFERARRDAKPIFLSIGYSTCHWCHVMEHESFESQDIARFLNEHFVSIKVDREERPDVDRVYMSFVQVTTGSGGWPMSVWLTPDLKPFYGGTYFPPSSRWGRPGFLEVLQEVHRVWTVERERVVRTAESLTERLRVFEARTVAGAIPGTKALVDGVAEYRAVFDSRRGGFGEAPKFPRPTELLYLFREFARTGETVARDMGLQTLRAMALGGMRDHIGGGFHRYSVDADWRVPHFEKMLYDQAQLAIAYLEAFQITGDAFYAEVAEDTLQYVRREMTNSEGGFYSAEDADSLPPESAGDPAAHKSEGAFYLWRQSEIEELLGDETGVFCRRFAIEPEGNAPFDPQNEFTGKNLLYIASSIHDIARLTGSTEEQVSAVLSRARTRLLEVRAARPRPHLDDKVLTAWNGLMIAAFARAARVLSDAQPHLESARRAAAFIRRTMWDPSRGVLLRRYRDGEAAIDGYAEDYAYLIWGLLELFQAGGDAAWLEWAITLQEKLDARFGDPSEGGWFSTTGQDRRVLLRMKEDYDGAEPTASSVAVMNLLFLSHLTAAQGFTEKIERTFRLFGERLVQQARVMPMMMAALSTYQAGIRLVVILGPSDSDETKALRRVLSSRYLPFMVEVPIEPGVRQQETGRILPFVRTMHMLDGRATAFVCEQFACRQPVNEEAALARELTSSAGESTSS